MIPLSTLWVVYLMSLHNKPAMKAVCDQAEWEALETGRPGYHTLVQAGIASEAEAETIARGKPEPKSGMRMKPRS